jgi:hypothetical protein
MTSHYRFHLENCCVWSKMDDLFWKHSFGSGRQNLRQRQKAPEFLQELLQDTTKLLSFPEARGVVLDEEIPVLVPHVNVYVIWCYQADV